MAFSDEDKHFKYLLNICVIQYLRQSVRYGSVRLLKEFPDKNWTRGRLDKLLKKGPLERMKTFSW